MTYIAKPRLHHPTLQTNKVGYTRRDYEGRISTLCAGCGHDSISSAIVQACWQLDIEPHRVAKLSGIGCSSKTPDYFLGNSHGFNSVHGRMPSVLTGANLANRDLIYLGVSGDGGLDAAPDPGAAGPPMWAPVSGGFRPCRRKGPGPPPAPAARLPALRLQGGMSRPPMRRPSGTSGVSGNRAP